MNRGRVGNERGMTLMELTVAGTLFMVFSVQVGSVFNSYLLHVKYVSNRTLVEREALVCRALMMGDIAHSDAATVSMAQNEVQLASAGPGATVLYYQDASSLVRTEQELGWSLTSARCLADAEFEDWENGSVLAKFHFQKGSAWRDLNVFLSVPTES